jgi:hypothetical protein
VQTIEHTLRFCKQRLGWDRARVRTPEQMDRWTWAVLAAYTQLRLASWSVDTLAGATRFSRLGLDLGHTIQCTKTLRALTGTSERLPFRTCSPIPGAESRGRTSRVTSSSGG